MNRLGVRRRPLVWQAAPLRWRGRLLGLFSAVGLLSIAVLVRGPAESQAATSVTAATSAAARPASAATGFTCNGQWQTVPSADPNSDYGDDDSLLAVSALTSNDAWAIGTTTDFDQPPYGYRTLGEHWDGQSWTAVSMPNPPGSTWNYLQAVTAVASNDVWAVGYQGSGPYTSLIEHWNGHSWRVQNGHMRNTYLTSVSASGPDDVWVAGSTNYPGKGLIMHWDGTRWTRTLINKSLVFRGIDELSPRDIWVVGQHSNGTTFGDYTAAYHFDGHRWLQYPTPNPLGKHPIDQNWLTSVHAVSARDVWATGVSRDLDYGILDRPFTAHWDGKQWSYVATPDPGGSTLNTDLWGMAAFGSNDVWAVGGATMWPQEQTFTAHWDGSSWTQVPSVTAGEFEATSPDTAGGLWAVGDQTAYNSNGTAQPRTLVEHLCATSGLAARSPAGAPRTAAARRGL